MSLSIRSQTSASTAATVGRRSNPVSAATLSRLTSAPSTPMARVTSAVPGSERIRSNSPMAGSLSVWSRVGEATLRPGIREVDVVDGEKQWRFGGLADQPVKRVQFGERVVFGGLRSAGGRDGIGHLADDSATEADLKARAFRHDNRETQGTGFFDRCGWPSAVLPRPYSPVITTVAASPSGALVSRRRKVSSSACRPENSAVSARTPAGFPIGKLRSAASTVVSGA